MKLPEDPEKPAPEFDVRLIPRLQKEGGLKKVDQILDIFRQSSQLYLDNLMGRIPEGPAVEKGEIRFWQSTYLESRPAAEQLSDELQVLDRFKQVAIRVGANDLAELCENLAAAVSRTKKPLDGSQLAALEKAAKRAREFIEDQRKKL
jgi:hypothetical protein